MKTVFITGANRGLGLEFTKQYLQMGNKVIACARNPDISIELIKLSEGNQNLRILPMELSNEDSINAAVAKVDEPVDLLINNAGIIGDRDEDLDHFCPKTLLDTFKINAIGPLLVLSALREHLAQGQGKQAIMIGDRMGSISDNATGGYYSCRASKSALNALMKSAAIELESDKVHVLILHPGWVQTDMGGTSATTTVSDSITNMIKVIDNYRIYPTGAFVAQTSELLPW
ncbi:MAG: SDR family oxidoreductase [Francisellaceae bacterium]|nr:SDR family oxidoreductase [Francisellaceae bacterium]MBT6208158.1 SDR family oxidoreductase [Francisellaceae bacterium]